MKKCGLKNAATILSMAALVGMTGCKVADNAQRSADNSEQAAGNSTKLLELNQVAFGDGRQGGTRVSRVDALDLLVKVTSLESKLAQAGSYYNALEFQLFKSGGFREDDASKQERLFQVAISETTKVIKDFDVIAIDGTKMLADAISPPHPVKNPQTGEEEQRGNPNFLNARNYAAMAMAMHNVSERQLDASTRYKFKAVSFYDVVSMVLDNKKSCEADPLALNVVPAYVFEGLKVSKDLEKMLQVRVNMMAGTALMALGSPMKLADPEHPEKGLIVTATAVQIKDAQTRMGVALQAKGLLAKSGLELPMFADVKGGLAQLTGALSKLPPEQIQADSKFPELLKLNEMMKGLLQ